MRSRQLLICIVALSLVGLGAVFVGWWFSSSTPRLPAKVPFSIGSREVLPDAATGLGKIILGYQMQFNRALQSSLEAIKKGASFNWLLMIAFAYGVFHAAGPGHGKAIISAYVFASGNALKRGISLSFCAALFQALIAITIVSVLSFVFKATAARMNSVTQSVEIAGFTLICILGLVITWRKAGRMALLIGDQNNRVAIGCVSECEPNCGHVHMPSPQETAQISGWQEWLATALAAGMRPCSGALVVLVFALSLNEYMAGIAATFAMAMGTAVTTSCLAVLAVLARSMATRMTVSRGLRAVFVLAAMETLAGAVIALLGSTLLFNQLALAEISFIIK